MSELHRNRVTDVQTIQDNLRDAAFHEAGHVVVARFLGLTVREVEIRKDGSGRQRTQGPGARCALAEAQEAVGDGSVADKQPD